METFKEHLKRRGLTPEIRCWVDHETEIVRFPMWAFGGKLIGYSRYDWRAEKLRSNEKHGRYINKVNPAYKKTALWGHEYCYKTPTIF